MTLAQHETVRVVRRLIADTTAMIIFSTLLGAFVEIIVTGLEPLQSLRIRLAAIPLMLISGRPYGIYRDWLFCRVRGARNPAIESILIDSFANATFQVPLYLGLLASGGATPNQMLVASVSILIMASVSGRPYGMFLNCCRRLLGVPRS